MSDIELSYREKVDTGELYVWPLSRWNGLLIKMGGVVGEMPLKDKKIIKCIIFPPNKVKAAIKLIDNINSGEQEYKGKLGKTLIDGGDNDLTLAEYGKGFAIYGVKWEDKGLHEKLKAIDSKYSGGIEPLRGTKRGGWILTDKNVDKARDIIKEYNSYIDDVPSEDIDEPMRENDEPTQENDEGYQEVRYYLEKPYVGQEVSINMLGKTINTKVISIVPGYSEVVDLIRLDDDYIAAIVAGRWELLYETNDHVLSFH